MRRILALVALSVALSLAATAFAFWFSGHRPGHVATPDEVTPET